jgi:hypothetical protein
MKDELKWQTFFDEDYLRIWSADLGESRSVADLEFLLRALELAPGMRVLDAPCGYGGRAAISYSWQGPGGASDGRPSGPALRAPADRRPGSSSRWSPPGLVKPLPP